MEVGSYSQFCSIRLLARDIRGDDPSILAHASETPLLKNEMGAPFFLPIEGLIRNKSILPTFGMT
jgi:hypothetical protein